MPPTLRRSLIVALIGLAVAATYVGGKRAGLDRAIPERFRIYGIPIALSQDVYGLHGYVGDTEIVRRFVNTKDVDVILSHDLPPPPLPGTGAGDRLFFVPADDKGDVTFTRMAFWTFGKRSGALYDMFFLLFVGSVLAFVVAFYSDLAKLTIGLAVVLGVYSLLSAFQEGLLPPHVVTFYDVRIFSVVASLAFIHLGFAVTDTRRVGPGVILGALYQALLLTLAIHVRSSSATLVAALGVWLAGEAVMCRRSGATGPPVRAWPLAMVIVCLGGLYLWERAAYHPRYFASKLAHHLFWHNVGIGFALHPALGAPYGYVMSDQAMIDRVARDLFEAGDDDAIRRVFGAGYQNPTGTAAGVSVDVGPFLHSASSDLALYDAIAGRIVRATIRAHPLQAAALFAYYKPRYLLAHLLWFSGVLTYDQPFIASTGRQSSLFRAPGDARQRQTYYTPVSMLGLVLFVAALILASPERPSSCGRAMLAFLLAFGASVVPLLIAYPAPLVMGESLLWLACTLYAALALAWAALLDSRGIRLMLRDTRSTMTVRPHASR